MSACSSPDESKGRADLRRGRHITLVCMSSLTPHLTSTYAAGSKHSIAPPNSFRRVAPEGLFAAAMPLLVPIDRLVYRADTLGTRKNRRYSTRLISGGR